MSALQESSQSRDQSLDQKVSDATPRLLPFDLGSNNFVKTLTSITQSSSTSVVIGAAGPMSLGSRGNLPPTVMQQTLVSRGSAVGVRVEGLMTPTSPVVTVGTGGVMNKGMYSQQAVAGSLPSQPSQPSILAITTSISASIPSGQMSGQGIISSVYVMGQPGRHIHNPNGQTVGSGGAASQPTSSAINVISNQESQQSLGAHMLPSSASGRATAIMRTRMPTQSSSDLRIAHPISIHAAHVPKAAVIASTLASAKTNLVTFARTSQPATTIHITTTATAPSVTGSVMLQNITSPQRVILPGPRSSAHLPRNVSPSLSLITTPRAPALTLQGWQPGSSTSSSTFVQPMKSQTDVCLQRPMSVAVHTVGPVRPIGHPPTILQHLPQQKVVLSSPSVPINLSSASISISRSVGQNQAINLSQTVPRPQKVVLSSSLPKLAVSTSLAVGKIVPSPQPAALNLSRQKKNIRLQSSTTSVSAYPISTPLTLTAMAPKTGVPVVSVQALGSVTLTSQMTSSGVPPSITSFPVAKVPPQFQFLHQSGSDSKPIGSIAPQQPIRPPASQAIPLQPAAMLLGGSYSVLPSGSLPVSLALPATQSDVRTQPERVLQQFAIQEARYYPTQAPQLMNLSNNQNLAYSNLQSVQTIAIQGSTLRNTSSGCTQLQNVTTSHAFTSAVAAIAAGSTQGTRIQPVFMSMDASRPSLSVQQSFASPAAATDVSVSHNADVQLHGSFQRQQSAIITLMQPPQQQQQLTAAADNLKQQTMSPRPPILRKRTLDMTVGSASKKNLLNSMTLSSIESVTSDIGMSVPASPKSFDISRENSQSSTDTASSAESTPRSCPPSVEKVRPDLPIHFENGLSTNSQDQGLKIVPRKKPRKQSLHANEEIPDGFSSDDDEADPMSAQIYLSQELEKITGGSMQLELKDYVDKDGFRWTHERQRANVLLTQQYHCNWKPRNNHFHSYIDVKSKEERRLTVNELANQKGIQQKASGSKLYHVAAQFEELTNFEKDTLERLLGLQGQIAPKSISRHLLVEDDVKTVHELTMANIQRCQMYITQLAEAQTTLLHLLDRKHRINEIINKHQSKRTVKKKDRS